jgi:dipeptidyl-peptidase-4
MKKHILSLIGVAVILSAGLSLTLAAQEAQPQTVAEATDYKATSRYVDVINFIREVQKKSPLIRVETMGVSPEGREIPLVIVGDPVPSSPLDLRTDPRAVVYIQGNIHAGEVEGKEASLMLIRDILQEDRPPYLDRLVLLFSPIFNADGNEKISPQNRRNQGGPEQGVGVRYNGQNLDLNRDSIKMESPELRGLVKNVLLRWDPVILVDCHTTNGSYHEEPVTYSWPLNPNGSMDILLYMRDTMMPALQKHLKDKYDTLGIPYGNFMGHDMSGWRTFSHEPRFVTNYVGLRNRLAILIENYAHAEFKTRVFGNYHYVKSILDYCHENRDAIQKMIHDADMATIKRGMNPTKEDTFAVEFEVKPLEEPVTILGYEMEVVPQKEGQRPRMRRTDTRKAYTIPYHADFQPKRSVAYPAAYLISVQTPEVLDKLRQHGIVVERLLKPVTLEVESFQVKTIKASDRLYQGHRMNNAVEGEYSTESREFGEGTYVVRTAQPLANLASYMLEPESDDGLLVWNYFDRYLVPQWRNTPQTYPVFKLYTPTPLVTEIIR